MIVVIIYIFHNYIEYRLIIIFTTKLICHDLPMWNYNGDKYIKKVEYVFRNSTMVHFIKHLNYCNNHPSWSRVCPSRPRNSISESDTPGYLATKLDTEDNYGKVRRLIKSQPSSNNVTTVRIYGDWQDHFGM